MASVELSKSAVDALEARDKPYIAYDAKLKGFGVRVMPSGAKSWIVEYRPGAGGRGVAKRRLALGATTLLTPAQARGKAKDHLAAARLGDDPAARRSSEREIPSLSAVIRDYLTDVEATLAPSTARIYRHYLTHHAEPQFGARKITSIDNSDYRKLHRSVGQKNPVTANRVVSTLSSMLEFARRAGLVAQDFNPLRGLDRFKEEPKERYLKSDELKRLGAVLREAESTGIPWNGAERSSSKHARLPQNRLTVFSPFVTAAIRLLLFTGCRLREILDLQWEHVDFQRGLLFLPSSKTGKKTVILNGPALEILSSLRRLGPYVIPGNDPNKPRADLHKPWEALTRRANLPGLRLHDLRHSFASVGVAGAFGLPIVGKLLGHATASSTNRYAHLDTDPLRRASNTIGAEIAAAMGDAIQAADVPPLKGGSR
jgi:integrase